MTHFTLFFGDSSVDEQIKHMLEEWNASNPDVMLVYESIHSDPTSVVRLGINDLPALVLGEEVIAQGTPESWITSLLHHVITKYSANA